MARASRAATMDLNTVLLRESTRRKYLHGSDKENIEPSSVHRDIKVQRFPQIQRPIGLTCMCTKHIGILSELAKYLK